MFEEAGKAYIVLDADVRQQVARMNSEKRKEKLATVLANIDVPPAVNPKPSASTVVSDGSPPSKNLPTPPKKAGPSTTVTSTPAPAQEKSQPSPQTVTSSAPTQQTPTKPTTPVEAPKGDTSKAETKASSSTPAPTQAKIQPTPQTVTSSVPEGNYDKVKALFEYTAQEDNELSFKEGDIIEVFERFDGSDWCKGRANGKVGLFPSNFTELVSKSAHQKTLDEVVALFDYEAQESNEISFKAGDVITIVDRIPDNDDWIIGKINNKVGMFPTSFAEKRNASSATVTPKSEPTTSFTPPEKKKVKAFCNYDAQEENELTFKDGDIITILEVFEGIMDRRKANSNC